jgi:hypothetical protein
MKNLISLGTFVYWIDFAEPPFVIQIHSPDDAPLLGPRSVPVQPAPSNQWSVADITGEAEATRATITKAKLNCIIH